ncbi:GRP family sugar transporter [Mucilaginibacter flavidus]|uniref:GRP family sugar transporter n=1 Tax=Mucilaginibacter flavidus TaxID=2949309 RepID=UPI002091EC8D|nr:GRP family sugar transporter [Mucilaginibacter flavidus]MCO5950452.1 GRP family sugar transporter [Mucilaginibacter flavidus]
MFIISTYPVAVLFCVITMICWGSWANTQKIAGKNWRFELFYWDYVIGVVLFSLLSALTLGSYGHGGRSFLADLKQADSGNLIKALIGGLIFNAANILLSAAISIAGMAVAFPVGIGIALVVGVVVNYASVPQGNLQYIIIGIVLIMAAIIVNAIAYQKSNKSNKKLSFKGLLLSVLAGLLMSLFYRFIASSMDLSNFEQPAVGKMTPYTAVFIFSLGIFISNFVFNSILIYKPFEGAPTSYRAWFKGKFTLHLTGILGGLIWGVGNSFNLIAAGKAGPAISYGLGQGATMVAAFWGVFIWKEFKQKDTSTGGLITAMFVLFIAGLGMLIYSGV